MNTTRRTLDCGGEINLVYLDVYVKRIRLRFQKLKLIEYT